jgi:Holliday junction resolvase-like predicted endonuclease
MIAPNLCEKFNEFNLVFLKSSSGTRVKYRENKIHFEIDFFLENGQIAMLVEVKTKLNTEDIKEHIERLEKMRKYADIHGDKRSFLGAVAGVVMTDYVKDYALKQGLFVVEPSGESFFITPPSDKPKEW